MSQDPYGGGGDFTPYQPDATPDSESGDADPFVPYGGAPVPVAYYATATPKKRSAWVGIAIGLSILVAVCAGVGVAIFAAVGTIGDAITTSDDEGLYANDLEVGQCLRGAGLNPNNDDPVSDLEEVDCAESHDAEVLAINTLDADEAAAYDFDDDNGAFESCRPHFKPAALKLLNREELFLLALTESATPATGDNVACLLVNADGSPLFGSLQDDLGDMVSPS